MACILSSLLVERCVNVASCCMIRSWRWVRHLRLFTLPSEAGSGGGRGGRRDDSQEKASRRDSGHGRILHGMEGQSARVLPLAFAGSACTGWWYLPARHVPVGVGRFSMCWLVTRRFGACLCRG